MEEEPAVMCTASTSEKLTQSSWKIFRYRFIVAGFLKQLRTLIGHFRVPFCLRVRTSLSAKPYENEFRLQVYFHVNQTHFETLRVRVRRTKELGNGL